MIQKEVVKNINKDYLRMECEAVPETNKYEYRMMNVDSIYGLLPCHIRYLNGIAYLYYDISLTKSFSNTFEKRSIVAKDMEKLIKAIRTTMESLERHLLEGENLVFDPELIFLDNQTEDIYFIYYPYMSKRSGSDFMKLVEFLTIHIDHDDNELVNKVYQLYEKMESLDDKIPFKDICTFLESKIKNNYQIIERKQERSQSEMIKEEEKCNQIIPIKETPAKLSLFEYRKGKIREKRIAYAVEEPFIDEEYDKK